MNNETLKRIEELKHHEELLCNVLEYLAELWGINRTQKEIIADLKNIMKFTNEDLEYFGIMGDE